MDTVNVFNSTEFEILPKYWQKSIEDNYNANDLISAYLKGKEAGKKHESDKITQEFSNNVKLASSIAEELFANGEECGLDFDEIHLKANSISSFEALFLVKKETILLDRFRQAYVIGRILKNKYEGGNFDLSFSFTPNTEEIDGDCLVADGFFMKYEKR
jgi:hypothetical protein